MLLDLSRQGDAVWRRAAITLTILQDAGSDGTVGSLHRRRTPGKEETGGCHIAWHYLHLTWRSSRNWEGQDIEMMKPNFELCSSDLPCIHAGIISCLRLAARVDFCEKINNAHSMNCFVEERSCAVSSVSGKVVQHLDTTTQSN